MARTIPDEERCTGSGKLVAVCTDSDGYKEVRCPDCMTRLEVGARTKRANLSMPEHVPYVTMCRRVRRMFTRHGFFNVNSGGTRWVSEGYEISSCNVPLFNEDERRHGICQGCWEGYRAPGNDPVGDLPSIPLVRPPEAPTTARGWKCPRCMDTGYFTGKASSIRTGADNNCPECDGAGDELVGLPRPTLRHLDAEVKGTQP